MVQEAVEEMAVEEMAATEMAATVQGSLTGDVICGFAYLPVCLCEHALLAEAVCVCEILQQALVDGCGWHVHDGGCIATATWG